VEVWNGSSWIPIWADNNQDLSGHQAFDVTAYAAGNPAFQVRFNYQNANSDLWFSVDEVEVIVDVLNPCSTNIGPPTAPAGLGGTNPLLANRLDPAGNSLDVAWDVASCTAAGYNLIYGNLQNVASYVLDGSECNLGTSGSFQWNGSPSGSLYFMVVGTDGAATEGSWGTNSFLGERNGLGVSGECGTTIKDTSGTCP
jgi:hypothetical protein